MAKNKSKRARRAATPSNPSWISDLAFDPAKHPDARALVGYLRQPSDSGPFQLYLNLDLNDYVEIQPGDVLDQKPYDSGAGVARTVVWVKGAAVVKEVRALRLGAQARFLSGRLVEQYLRSASAMLRGTSPPDEHQTQTTFTCMSVCIGCLSYVC